MEPRQLLLLLDSTMAQPNRPSLGYVTGGSWVVAFNDRNRCVYEFGVGDLVERVFEGK